MPQPKWYQSENPMRSDHGQRLTICFNGDDVPRSMHQWDLYLVQSSGLFTRKHPLDARYSKYESNEGDVCIRAHFYLPPVKKTDVYKFMIEFPKQTQHHQSNLKSQDVIILRPQDAVEFKALPDRCPRMRQSNFNMLLRPVKNFFIAGLGCRPEQAQKYPTSSYHCDTDVSMQMLNIAKTYACGRKIGSKNKFVQQVYQAILKELDAGLRVHALGHSYGGMVMNVIAEMMQDDPRRSLLRITTTGSIYIAPKVVIDKVDITNIMAPGDIALRCNHLDNKDQRVLWLEQQSPDVKPQKSLAPWGSPAEWVVHNNERYMSVLGACLEQR